ncbi:hypothetical protein GUB10_02655 [Salegentibacter sp. BLCTC]|uniref:hypothetical protein n=1 Tax=Salegentibacter sp. BLCTC TaxID=2697368 RepID=UPI00187B2AA2|nr:hypothetical protein [Salegentibacter sp. BLCTC]MBE7639222.1 hypothetical protein [Salegentibacter sp. BLCTC]
MKFKDRLAVIEKLNIWEKEYPVDIWKIQGVHIWPILKMIIFFKVHNRSKAPNVKGLKSSGNLLIIKVIKNVFKKIKAWFILKSFNIKKVDFLFSGAPSHRVRWENNQFNRYFDPIADYLECKGEAAYFLEYKNVDLKSVYKPSRCFDITSVLPAFSKKIKFDNAIWNDRNVFPEFTSFLEEVVNETDLAEQELKKLLVGNIQGVLSWAALYEYFLRKTKAKYIFGLCYYSTAIFGMNLAARRLGVTPIDMQHGSQGPLHFAYYFNKTPENDYNILPKKFWVWDNLSFNNISNWTINNNHSAVLGGNPWIQFLEEKLKDEKLYQECKPMILFTLQPLNPAIDDYFLEVISLTCQKYNWWLRLHPRMTKEEFAVLDSKLIDFNIREQVNVEEASSEPLPLLLKECSLHVSKYSGSISEAALMNRPSLIIDEIGLKSFKDLVKEKLAFSGLSKDKARLLQLIEQIITGTNLTINDETQVPICYKPIIDEFIKET